MFFSEWQGQEATDKAQTRPLFLLSGGYVMGHTPAPRPVILFALSIALCLFLALNDCLDVSGVGISTDSAPTPGSAELADHDASLHWHQR